MLRVTRAVLIITSLLLAAGAVQAANGFLPVDEAFRLSLEQGQDNHVELVWQIAPGYYLYRHRLRVEVLPAGNQVEIQKPVGEAHHDPFFGDTQIYRNNVHVSVEAGSATALRVHWQGCADAGLCYPPQARKIDLLPVTPVPANTGGAMATDQALAATLASATFAWTLLLFFGMGLLLTFTLCVLPMIPILSGVVVGAGAGTRRSTVLSLAFIVPMALTYAVLGIAAGLAGSNLSALLQTPWVLGGFGGVFLLLALSLFGLFELQIPAVIRERLDLISRKRAGGTLAGAAAMGALSALLVSPCMTVPLAGVLLYIAQTGNALVGGSALLSLGLGMGTPLLLVGIFGASLLPRPGPWMRAVKVSFGFIMLAMGVYLVQRILPGPVTLALWGLLVLIIAVTLVVTAWRWLHGALPRLGASATGVVVGLTGVFLLAAAATGASSPWALLPGAQANNTEGSFMTRFEPVADNAALSKKLAAASRAGQWTLVDFYADWCVSCKVIEEEVFGDPRVQARLSEFRLLRPDITEYDAGDRAMVQRLNILGPPTILFIGPDGEEQRAARVIGEISADAFLKRMRQLQEAG